MEELNVEEQDFYELPAELDYTGLQTVAGVNLPELRYPPWTPMHIQLLHEEQVDIFGAIRNGDILAHHPYEDFSSSVEQFIQAAASDPRVLAIKTVVYRTGYESPFIHTLIRAAEDGKQVACLVELKARFDEERNIHWAQTMEKAGIHVVYGLVGLKTHSKTTLVIRNETEGIRCYAHIGTGNYHSLTARLYTDLSLLTCRTEITDDLLALFNRLTGRALNSDFHHLLVAPDNMRDRFLQLIENETAQAQAGQPARIIAKMNSLEDEMICEALYRASAAGVRIDLIVRGFCCLRPGVPELSENIRVISVIGRFLEHSRIFYFGNGTDDPLRGIFLIGSADWMYRNLSARVEVVVPLARPMLLEKCWEILQALLQDNRQAWELTPDGTYHQIRPQPDAAERGAQQTLMQLTRQRLGTV
ncbi:MAG: polyphosphate kinase 1 [Lentisphaerae bacterium]|nr:polyphosphate kinase 1 [Lentisphaerota bacterium]